MAKLNTGRPTQVYSPVRTSDISRGRTYEGAPGYARDAQSELFTLGVSLMAGEDTFYEKGKVRNRRFIDLIHECTKKHPVWTADFLRWLRTDAHIRTASLIGAAEYVRAWGQATCFAMGCTNPANSWSERDRDYSCSAHQGTQSRGIQPRKVVDSVIQRGDEPGEIIAYWLATYGRSLPKALKRGTADAMIRLGTERNYLKYGNPDEGVCWADILQLCHPGDRPGSAQHLRNATQDALFGYIVESPHNKGLAVPDGLLMLRSRQRLMAIPVNRRREVLDSPMDLKAASMTRESLAGWLQGPMDAKAYTAIIPSMGYMALLRNLANFDKAEVSDEVVRRICNVLTHPDGVANCKQFPYRFLSAYKTVPSDRWGHALGTALDLAVRNIPRLPGRSLILCDMSGSMEGPLSDKSVMTRVEAAALFAVAQAYRCGAGNVDLFGYATGSFRHSLAMGGSVLKQTNRLMARVGEVGHGTHTGRAVHSRYDGQDRVIIFTDEQCTDSFDGVVPTNIPVYTFNLGGYRLTGHGPSGQDNRHTLAGLTDATFRMIPVLESRTSATWPWQSAGETTDQGN